MFGAGLEDKIGGRQQGEWRNLVGECALREAAYGNFARARKAAAAGLKLDAKSHGVAVEAALAYAITGDTSAAQTFAQDLNQRYDLDTQMQSMWLPAIQE